MKAIKFILSLFVASVLVMLPLSGTATYAGDNVSPGKDEMLELPAARDVNYAAEWNAEGIARSAYTTLGKYLDNAGGAGLDLEEHPTYGGFYVPGIRNASVPLLVRRRDTNSVLENPKLADLPDGEYHVLHPFSGQAFADMRMAGGKAKISRQKVGGLDGVWQSGAAGLYSGGMRVFADWLDFYGRFVAPEERDVRFWDNALDGNFGNIARNILSAKPDRKIVGRAAELREESERVAHDLPSALTPRPIINEKNEWVLPMHRVVGIVAQAVPFLAVIGSVGLVIWVLRRAGRAWGRKFAARARKFLQKRRFLE